MVDDNLDESCTVPLLCLGILQPTRKIFSWPCLALSVCRLFSFGELLWPFASSRPPPLPLPLQVLWGPNQVRTPMHAVVYGHGPQYLMDMVVFVSQLTGRSHLRSAQKREFDIPHTHTTFGSRSFSVTDPQTWNHLPADIRRLSTISTFKRHLKIYLLMTAYSC